MADANSQARDARLLELKDLQKLLDALKTLGYETLGPTVRDGVVVFQPDISVQQLPRGIVDHQAPGTYRLEKGDEDACFGYVLGPYSLKNRLHPPRIRLWKARLEGQGFTVEDPGHRVSKQAFLGVRACEIAALSLWDKVLGCEDHGDPRYRARRKHLFLVAVNCTRPGGTCFCASMGTGPRVEAGFDILLTEIPHQKGPLFVAEVGSEAGKEVMAGLSLRRAKEAHTALAARLVREAAGRMGRTVDVGRLGDLFLTHFDHPHWDDVARRCLTCGNCTLVCPTCFCITHVERNDLEGRRAERRRVWDSCFVGEFSYIHGGNIRASEKSRYRQWLTHKLSTWIGQFGSPGCVGCGRCITWCPVGIDITRELQAILNG
jgi:sulfhydrogenase subunit beta (sulfur reductase)